jgi:uncharacterized membrane protein
MKAVVFAVLAGLCWGVGEVCTKYALHSREVGPVTAIALRSTVALPLLWLAYAVVVRGLRLEPLGWPHAGRPVLAALVLGSGITAGAVAMIFFYSALNLGDISTIKPIAFTIAPATSVLLGWLVLGESMSARKAVAVGLILLGVGLLTGSGTRPAGSTASGTGNSAAAPSR